MPSNDEKWMSHALDLARQAAELDEVPVGAVLVQGEKIIGSGYNQVIGLHDPTAHAEIQALRQAASQQQNYRLPDTTLYVTIEPCAMCAGALIHARVSRLVFGASEPKAGVAISQAHFFEQPFLNHRLEVSGGILEAECSLLISDFFRHKRQA